MKWINKQLLHIFLKVWDQKSIVHKEAKKLTTILFNSEAYANDGSKKRRGKEEEIKTDWNCMLLDKLWKYHLNPYGQ